MDRLLIVLEFSPDRFQLRRDLPVVQLFTRLRIFFQQVGPDHGAGKIPGNQAPDFTGFDDIGPDPLKHLGRRSKVRWNDITAGKTVLHDLDESNIRRKYGTDAGPVYSGNEKHLVGDLLKGVEKLRRKHVAFARRQRDQHTVCATKFLFVLQEGLHVLVIER